MSLSLQRLTELVEGLTKRTSMYVMTPDYNSVTAYLCGFDSALDGAPLRGFFEWLRMRSGKAYNVYWPALLECEVLGDMDQTGNRPPEAEAKLLEALRDTLTAFLEHRERIGLRNVLYDYGVWVRQFDWFDENVERYGTSHPDQPAKDG